VGKKVKALRHKDIVPGVIYGHGVGSLPVQFDGRELQKAINQAGTSSTIQVYVEGNDDPYLAIFRAVQIHPIKRNVIHLDLQALDVTETVRVPVSVVLIGESPALEEGGVLLQILNELEIEALPTALVPQIEVDISVLTEIGQSIAVGDITPPEGVTILNTPSDSVVQISWVAEEEEEEEEAFEFELDAGDVEVITSRSEEEEVEE
jgi:large subunit ribosomal protein L25